MSQSGITHRTYPNTVFYQLRSGSLPQGLSLIPKDTLVVMEEISHELHNFSVVRKKKHSRSGHRQKGRRGAENEKGWRASKPVVFEASKTDLEEGEKQYTKLLNKLSHPNVEVISREMTGVFTDFIGKFGDDAESIDTFLDNFVEQLYVKAIREPLFYKDYVFLVDYLILQIQMQHVVSKFVEKLQHQCKHRLECLIEKIQNKIVFVQQSDSVIEDNTDSVSATLDMKGFCHFLSELYLHKHIGLSVISGGLDDISELYLSLESCTLDSSRKDEVKNIFETIIFNYCYICFPLISSEYFPIETYLSPLEKWGHNKTIPPKSRFLIADLLEEFQNIQKIETN